MNITDYIKTHERLKDLDFLTVYTVIMALVKDGFILMDSDVSVL